MMLREPIDKRPPTTDGFVLREAEDDVARQLFRCAFREAHETLILAGFDAYARLVAFERVDGGDARRCPVPPHCWRALLAGGVATVLMAHNHPSGSARPSDADLACTRDAARLLRLVGVELADHLIFVESGHFSFRHARLV